MKDFMANYNKLSEVCFAYCIWEFTSRKISGVLENKPENIHQIPGAPGAYGKVTFVIIG